MNTKRLFFNRSKLTSPLSFLVLLTCFIGLSSTQLQAQEKFFFNNGGTISTTDETTICVDDTPDPIYVNLQGAYGFHKKWVITDADNNILALPASPPFDFNEAGPGVCKIWHCLLYTSPSPRD